MVFRSGLWNGRRLGINIGVEAGELVRLDSERSTTGTTIEKGRRSISNCSVDYGCDGGSVMMGMPIESARIGITVVPIERCIERWTAIVPIKVHQRPTVGVWSTVDAVVSVSVESVPNPIGEACNSDETVGIGVGMTIDMTVAQGTTHSKGNADLLAGFHQGVRSIPTHGTAAIPNTVVNICLGTHSERIWRAARWACHPTGRNWRWALVLKKGNNHEKLG